MVSSSSKILTNVARPVALGGIRKIYWLETCPSRDRTVGTWPVLYHLSLCCLPRLTCQDSEAGLVLVVWEWSRWCRTIRMCSWAVASCRTSLWETGNHGGVVYGGRLVWFLWLLTTWNRWFLWWSSHRATPGCFNPGRRYTTWWAATVIGDWRHHVSLKNGLIVESTWYMHKEIKGEYLLMFDFIGMGCNGKLVPACLSSIKSIQNHLNFCVVCTLKCWLKYILIQIVKFTTTGIIFSDATLFY
jgi:hypothetical protein